MASAFESSLSGEADDFDFDESARKTETTAAAQELPRNGACAALMSSTRSIFTLGVNEAETDLGACSGSFKAGGGRKVLEVSTKGLLHTSPPSSYRSPKDSPSWHAKMESPRDRKMFFSKLQQSRSVLSMSNLSGLQRVGADTLEECTSCGSITASNKNESMSDIDENGDEELVDWIEEASDNGDFSMASIVAPVQNLDPNPENLSTDELQLKSELRKVEDLRFDTLPISDQLEIIRSLEVQYFSPGEHIVTEGDDATGFYLVLGPTSAEVEVVKKSKGLITHLKQGKCFGEKFFISRREAKRTATIAAVTRTKVGLVSPGQFHKWDNFRLFLLMRTFPLIKTLPKSDQFEMYNLFTHEEFAPGEFIVRQGDFGDKFYIIVEGSADVKELDPDFGDDYGKSISLTRLYEGHSFGEMALIFDEPRYFYFF